MTKLAKSKRTDIASTRVCTMGEFETSVFLHAHCSCGHENHSQTLEIELDEDCDIINLLIYSKIVTPYVHEPSCNAPFLEKVEYFYKDWKARFSWIISIIFKGYVQAENVFTLDGDKQIEDYIDAISRAKNVIWLNKQRKQNGTNN